MNKPQSRPPAVLARSAIQTYRVPFYDTDAMGVVHHSNYVRYLELGRVRYLAQFDEPYQRYVDQGIHVAVTHVEARFHRPARFDDVLTIACSLAWIKAVSLQFDYEITCRQELVVSAITRHAAIDQAGRPKRIPGVNRARLQDLAGPVPLGNVACSAVSK